MLYFTSPWYFLSTNLYFPFTFFTPVPQASSHVATTSLFSGSMSLNPLHVFIYLKQIIYLLQIARFSLDVPKHNLPVTFWTNIPLSVLFRPPPAHLQAPHSNVPFPSWHFGLPGMPSLWHSHSQMNWRIISTSSVKPRGLILMVSEFLFGHLFEVMLISNWTLKEKMS